MALKGKILKDVISGNNFVLLVGAKAILCTNISSIEETLQTIDLPDGTTASGGRTEVSEFSITVPAHHEVDVAFMDHWMRNGKSPVVPGAYRTVVVKGNANSGGPGRTDTCFGTHVVGRSSSEYSMEDGGTSMTTIEYTLRCDNVVHLHI